MIGSTSGSASAAATIAAVESVETEYPDWSFVPDPEPVEDAMQQEPTLFRIVPILKARFHDRADVLVAGAGFLCYDRSNLNARLAPDCIVAFGVDPDAIRRRNGYLIWEVGKPPDLVMEVASESTAPNDIGRKRVLYAAMGIGEYWRLDATGGDLYGEALAGEYLLDGEYRRYDLRSDSDGRICGHSAALDLNICWDGMRFDIQDPLTGEYHKDHIESRDALLESRDALLENRQALLESRQALLDSEARNAELQAELERLRRG